MPRRKVRPKADSPADSAGQAEIFEYQRDTRRSDVAVLEDLMHFRRVLEHDGLAWLLQTVQPLEHFYELSAAGLRQIFNQGRHHAGWVHAETLASHRQHTAARKYGDRLHAALQSTRYRGELLLPSSLGFRRSLRRSSLAIDWIFSHGSVPISLGRPIVAIVGSRNSSKQQLTAAAIVAEAVGAARGTVVTGLATGADIAAHRAARPTEASLVAVLGSGAGRVYPPEHLLYVQELIAGRGTVYSELAPDQSANQMTFVLRNRIVAALADVVVTVSGKYASGTAHTVRFAAASRVPVVSVDPDPNSGITKLVLEHGGAQVSASEFTRSLPREP